MKIPSRSRSLSCPRSAPGRESPDDPAALVKKPDEEIKREIERIWRDNEFMYETDVAVAVKDGIATLTGEVDTWEMRYVLGPMASQGGGGTCNQLKVHLEEGIGPGYAPRPGQPAAGPR